MEATPTDRRLVALAEEECWGLLATRTGARFGVFVDNRPHRRVVRPGPRGGET